MDVQSASNIVETMIGQLSLVPQAPTSVTPEDIIPPVNTSTKPDLESIRMTGLLDTPSAMKELLDTLVNLPTSPPSLYIDLEGINLSRLGSVSILQLLVFPTNKAYLIDVHVLGEKAFSTPGSNNQTFKDILESPSIPKVFFDVRNDSDALFSHFKINLAGIVDLQLMELAARTSVRKFVNGLSKCLERDLEVSWSERQRMADVKTKGVRLFAPEMGGRYEVFNARPLPEDLRRYCLQDVQCMPLLFKRYDSRISQSWRNKIEEESKRRVAYSQTSSFNGKGRHMSLAPSSW